MRDLPSLAALRAFEATARHLSAKHAAAELFVTPTAISHQVRSLEASLKLALFIRRPRRLILTAEGLALYEALRQGFDLFAQTIQSISAPRSRRAVTLSTTPGFAAKCLLPRIASFQNEHSQLDLKIHASHQPVALDGSTADVAIRYGRGTWPGYVAEKLFDNTFSPACSPLLGLHDPKGLLSQTLIHFEWQPTIKSPPTWRKWNQEAGLASLDTSAGLIFSDESHAITAAVAGQGVALLGNELIADELRSGALVQPFGPILDGDAYYFIYPEARRDDPPIQALRQWVMEQILPPDLTEKNAAGRPTARAARRPEPR